jgi:hypothetical protein
MTIPVVQFRKHVKPYWTSDVKLAHSEILFKRQICNSTSFSLESKSIPGWYHHIHRFLLADRI